MSIKDIFLKNWVQKSISLLIAVALFVFVRGMLTHELRIPVKLGIKNKPSYLMSIGRLDETITVTVKGIKSKLNGLDAGRITASVDMADAIPGLNEFPVILQYPGYSEDLQLSTTVRSLRIEMDYAMERMLPLIPVLKGSPADGFKVFATNIEPAMILVRGPSLVLSNLASLPTTQFSVSGLKTSISSPIQVDLGSLNLELRQNGQIMLRLQIVAEQQERVFEGIIPSYEGLSPKLRVLRPVDMPKIKLTLVGDTAIIGALKEGQLRLVLPVSNLPAGAHEVRLVPVVPLGVRVKKTDPESVALEIVEGVP
jgi:YbbR domain-containing protein